MSYTPTTWTTGDTITATAMNKIENGIANAGSDYDLVILYDRSTLSASIVSGDILDCEDKLDNGEIVKAICVFKNDWSYIPSSANTNSNRWFLPLTQFEAPYRNLHFGGVRGPSLNNSSAVSLPYVTIIYDASTGAITNAYYGGV